MLDLDKGLQKMDYFPPETQKKIAAEHTAKFRKRVSEGKDKDGVQFAPYSDEYAEKKASGFKGKRAEAGLQNVGLNRQISPPNLTLRGFTMRDLKYRGSGKDYYLIGWKNSGISESASIIEDNAYRKYGAKRNVIDGIPDSELEWVRDQYGDSVQKQWNKIKDVTQIKVGK